MRILLVSSSSGSRGGGEIFLLYLAEALGAAGHTVALWAARHPRMDELARRFATYGEVLRDEYTNTYDRWHRGLLAPGRAAGCAITQRWLAWQPDLIHVNKQNLEDGNDLLVSADLLGLPSLCTIHITQSAEFLGARFARWRDARARAVLRSIRMPLVTVSSIRHRELVAFLGQPERIEQVLNGVPSSALPDRTALRMAENLAAHELGIVAVGRLESQKQPLRFIEYAARISKAVPQAQFRWIGSGRLADEWDRAIAERKLRFNVSRIAWRNDARAALPAYDLFLHTAAYEGLPLALLEAMDAGLPCAVESGVHSELPVSLQTCSIVITDATDWSALLADRTRLSALGAEARAVVRAQFSTAAMGDAYARIYSRLCHKP